MQNLPKRVNMAGINAKLGQGHPSISTLTRISVAINVVILMILLPATIVLHQQLRERSRLHCSDPSPGEYDVTARHDDITESQGEGGKANNVSRYCYREGAEACVERGDQVKVGADGQSLCCGHLGNRLFSIMGQAVQDTLRADSFREQLLQKVKHYITKLHRDSQAAIFRPAAHVGILPNGNLVGPENHVPRVQWAESAEGTFLTGGVVHEGDRLTVSKPGYYYVYSGLQFNVEPHTERHWGIVAYLFRTVNGTEDSRRKLMTSRESWCGGSREEASGGPVSLHMAGIFLLRHGDQISVRTTSHSLLDRSPAASYLGMHMV